MKEKPNVFILTADSLRADAFTDRMGSIPELVEGVRFADAVATANATAHSVPALAAGVYADTSGYGLEEAGDDNITTAAEQFTSAGYACNLWSANPLFGAEQNYDRGFTEENSGESSWKKQSQSLLQKTKSETLFNFGRWSYFHLIKPVQDLIWDATYFKSARSLHNSALSWLDDKPEKPSLCWFHYMDTHHPFDPPPEYLENYDFKTTHSRNELAELSTKAIRSGNATHEELEDIKRAYWASCDYWCEEVRNFIEQLKDQGHFIPERDILVITSDHGEGFSPDQHDMLGHTPTPAFWEEIIRVPLIINHPEWGSATVNGQVSLIDVMPTVLQAAGLEVPDTFEGSSGETPSDLVVETAYLTAIGGERFAHGVRHNSGWKLFADRISDDQQNDINRELLTKYRPGHEEVIHRRDIGSQSLPSDNPAHAKWQELYDLLRNHREGLFTDETEEISPELRKQLYDLGYVDDIPADN